MNSLTPYHAKYFAYELTKRSSSDSMQKLASTLVDAQVDLNPHQVDAALFAFRSPLSKGAILADEVGLGKTIEAGLVIAQKWAERKRKIIVITPANLRKQWVQELQEKFFLNAIVLESKSFNDCIRKGNLNPFDQLDIIICSYQFARTKEPYLKSIQWDLAVVDEAHRLKNVYRPGNKIANSIKHSLIEVPKILLTATPLQNTLLELYGLVSIIDDHAFGDLRSFKAQYSRINSGNKETFNELKERLKPICKRTLRRQVLEYIQYTNRIALVEEFYPTEDEKSLYNKVSQYLQTDKLYALPASQRKLMTLILRKLLASSTFAISGTLERLANKLEDIVNQSGNDYEYDFPVDFETFNEIKSEWGDEEEWEEEEWEDDNPTQQKEKKFCTPKEIQEIRAEIAALKEFEALAKSIRMNSKGEKLFTALERGFNEMARLGAPRKAIIFTESRRTQIYLSNILEARGYADEVVLFNGSNTDPKSIKIYVDWEEQHKNTDKVTGIKAVDMRAALVDYFRDKATIMIATEAAAEGINLQFCSMVINYDMPWNPQRIEQRIGRCHRYGQKYDVVVVNFLNKSNAADIRVYELLRDKFQLFNGVFGASDEVLGSIESGVDFEKRIARIYQECRTQEQIQEAFNELQAELDSNITDAMQETRQKLLENFDEEVHEKLKMNLKESKDYLSKYESWLWHITRFALNNNAAFSADYCFRLIHNPYSDLAIHSGPYRIGKAKGDDANVYRIGHPLAQRIIEECKSQTLPSVELTFDYSNGVKKISILEPYVGQSGYMIGRVLSVTSFDVEEWVQLCAITQEGNALSKDICERFFSLPAFVSSNNANPPNEILEQLEELLGVHQNQVVDEIGQRNANYFQSEMDKLDLWGEDKRSSLKTTLKELDLQIREKKKQIKEEENLQDKLSLERERRQLESDRDAAWREYDAAAREIERSKDKLIEHIEQRLAKQLAKEDLFLIKWHLI